MSTDAGEALSYKRIGEDSPRTLVLVHGFLGSSAYWLPLQTGLKDYFDVIAVDLPGFGQSAKIPGPDSIVELSTTVIGLLNKLNVDRFSLLGFSMGGMVSQQLHVFNFSLQIHAVLR